MLDALALLALLVGLELVLGVDNVLVIAILVRHVAEEKRQMVRLLGLGLALVARVIMLGVVLSLAALVNPVIWDLSVRDIILLVGGLFLLWKASSEIHRTVTLGDEHPDRAGVKATLSSIIFQIVMLDIVFSVDSVITAVGLTDQLWIILTSVLASFIVIMFFARPVGEFILKHPSVKILALSFLITIGVTLFMEGMGQHIPKAYIYLPMGFALLVDLLQMKYESNRKKLKERDLLTEGQ